MLGAFNVVVPNEMESKNFPTIKLLPLLSISTSFEYNIFKTENGLLLFDLGSAVDLRHPNANEFLNRDINNITKFFVKRGLTVANPVDVLLKVTK